MKSLHLNNSSKSKQSVRDFAAKVFTEIMEGRDDQFQISVDDGDGDVWKITITKESELLKPIGQITEN